MSDVREVRPGEVPAEKLADFERALEGGKWKVVHRHGDPYDDSPSALASQLRGDS